MINRNVRSVSFLDILKIYFATGVLFLGEIFLVVGIVMLSSMRMEEHWYIGFIPLVVGGFFILQKINMVRKSMRPLKYGKFVNARLIEINRTNVRHNRRTVMEYLFSYEVDGTQHEYSYKTAKRTGMAEGMTFELLYDPVKPEQSIIPKLYNLSSFERS